MEDGGRGGGGRTVSGMYDEKMTTGGIVIANEIITMFGLIE